jgi:hypothetical protein
MLESRSVESAEVRFHLTHQLRGSVKKLGSVVVMVILFPTVRAVNLGVYMLNKDQLRKIGENDIMGRPLHEKYPTWLYKWFQSGRHPRSTRYQYYHQLFIARPPWANVKAIRDIYREAEQRRRAGEYVVVDHIVPLNHPYVCGLDCEANLQVISGSDNSRKSNYYWPDCWHENQTLHIVHEPHQLSLSL